MHGPSSHSRFASLREADTGKGNTRELREKSVTLKLKAGEGEEHFTQGPEYTTKRKQRKTSLSVRACMGRTL